MRTRRELGRVHLRSAVGVVSCGALIFCTAPIAGATPAAASGPATLASGSLVAPPHQVVPTVKAQPIPAVAAAARPATQSEIGRTAPPGLLVAHVRRPAVHPFSMVAVTWAHTRRPVDIRAEVRTRSAGAWSPWTPMSVDGDGPSARQDSLLRDGTSPVWVDDATGVEVAVYAPAGVTLQGLQVDTIDPGTSALDAAVPASAATAAAKGGHLAGTFPGIPRIVTRAQWGADESLGDRCWDPKYGSTFKAVVVHHTAGSNHYSRREAASVVRGVLAYHTISRGWCDIGYNFLIDRYGTIYEGRAGGIRQPVRGAHAGDYNVDTTGISMMGNFDLARPTKAMEHSLVELVAWRLGTAYHGAYGRPFLYDGRFNRISGHRDVMSTSCPGRYGYSWLPNLRERVQARLGDWKSRIERTWLARGGAHSDLGSVRVGEREEHGGHHTTFAYGRMYFSHHATVTLYPGPILHAYRVSGETGGQLGYPATHVRSSAKHGLSAEFTTGRIYWSRPAGGHVMRRGAILRRYLQTGGSTGVLGFPVSSIHAMRGGTRDRFQHGTISYDFSSHKTKVTVQ
jgi:hypothetical protein